MIPTAAAAASPHLSAQFLSNVLSQRGPDALPYEEDVKRYIRQHLLGVIQAYPSLQVRTALFTHNDGRSMNLLQAEGTVPMIYKDIVYNIPVVIWLVEGYPRQPPLVFVTPTRDMIIKRDHSHVDPSGMVKIHYLENWVFPSSNLVDLVRNLSVMFGHDPPLFTKTNVAQPRPSPHPSQVHPPHRNQIHAGQLPAVSTPIPSPIPPSHVYHSGYTRPTPPAPYGAYQYSNNRPQSQPSHSVSPQPARTSDDPSEGRKNLINTLMGMLHNDMSELRRKTEVEIEALFNAQSVLRQREEQLDKGLSEMQNEKECLEQKLQLVLTNTDVLETWLHSNDGKLKSDIDIDDVFEPSDVLSKQMLECSSADLAIEDILYSLDRAVQQGSIPVDAYLKNVRALSREQFFHRATIAKVRAAQMQSQVANMAARASPYG